MKNKPAVVTAIVILVLTGAFIFAQSKRMSNLSQKANVQKNSPAPHMQPLVSLSIQSMRQKRYPGSNISIVQDLTPGINYNQYLASYKSDGLMIYALLTVPKGTPSEGGWPAIIFNHGYIPPEQYSTTQRYASYVDAFARNGYVVFKPDYRGNGNSQGNPEGAYYSPAYATDVLNALSSVKKLNYVNPNKIGMWGHSMGGNITLRAVVVDTKDIKAAVIWGGVVGSYTDLMYGWHRSVPFTPSQREIASRSATRQNYIKTYGTPEQNPGFWNSIDPTYYLSDIKTPIQLDVGSADREVPPQFSVSLYTKLKSLGKTVEFYEYPGSDHNISQDFNLAMQRSIDFFNKYLK